VREVSHFLIPLATSLGSIPARPAHYTQFTTIDKTTTCFFPRFQAS